MTTVNATLQDPGFPGSVLESFDLAQAFNDASLTFEPLLDSALGGEITITSANSFRINFIVGGRSGFLDGFFNLSTGSGSVDTFFLRLPNGGSLSFSGPPGLPVLTIDDFGNVFSGTLGSFSLNTAALRFGFSGGNASLDLNSGTMSGTITQFNAGFGALNIIVVGSFTIQADGEITGTVGNVTFNDAGLGNLPGAPVNSFQLFFPNVDIAVIDELLAGATTAQEILDSLDYSGNDSLVLDFLFGANVDSGAGHDHLQGGRGNDTLNGGAGDDNIVGGEIFNILKTDGDDLLFGGEGNDSIGGGDGADTLDGGAGNDFLEGGDGNDVVSYASASGPVTVSLADGGASADGSDTFTDVEGLRGSNFSDSLTGTDGSDFLDGGAGNDTTVGGAGNDVHAVTNAGDVTQESPGSGTDTVHSTINWVLQANTENLLLLSGALAGTGNELPNLITGNAGHNTLNGGGGADTLLGGLGNDTYILGPGDVWTDTGGTDTVVSSGSFFTLPSSLENVALSAGAGNGWVVGSAIGNHFVGNAGANLLMGGDGADTLEGGRGDDTLLGGTGNDRLDGGRGTDVMEGGTGNDVYVASGVRDQILELAAGGNDTVEIEAARFTLPDGVENALLARDDGVIVTGNALANRFIFDDTGGVDLIFNFATGADKIVLDDDAFAGVVGSLLGTPLPAGAFRAGAGVTANDADDRVLYDTASGALYFDADGSGGGAAVQFATLGSGTVHPSITAADILIIS